MVASGVGPDGSSGFGPGGFGAGGGHAFHFDTDGGGLGDIFGNLFGGGAGGRRRSRGATGPQRGRDLETELHLQFEDAIRGVTSTVRFRADATCSTCAGSGAASGNDAGDLPRVPRRRYGRRQPGPLLVLTGVPHVRWPRSDHPDPVPDVCRARRRGARPRGEGADPGGCRRRRSASG